MLFCSNSVLYLVIWVLVFSTWADDVQSPLLCGYLVLINLNVLLLFRRLHVLMFYEWALFDISSFVLLLCGLILFI